MHAQAEQDLDVHQSQLRSCSSDSRSGQQVGLLKQTISRAQAEERMFAKLDDRGFLADVRPLLAAEEDKKFDNAAAYAAFVAVFQNFIKRIPGKTWKKTNERAIEFGLPELAEG